MVWIYDDRQILGPHAPLLCNHCGAYLRDKSWDYIRNEICDECRKLSKGQRHYQKHTARVKAKHARYRAENKDKRAMSKRDSYYRCKDKEKKKEWARRDSLGARSKAYKDAKKAERNLIQMMQMAEAVTT